MDFSKIIDIIKQPRFVITIAVTTGLILFLPLWILQQIGIDQMVNSYRPIIGIVFLGSTTLSFSHGVTIFYFLLRERRQHKIEERRHKQLLEEVLPDEKAILRQFINANTKTQRLDVDSGIVLGLVSKGILYPATDRSTANVFHNSFYGPVYTCDHNMTDWAWKYLQENKEIITSSKEHSQTKTTEEIKDTTSINTEHKNTPLQ